MKIEMLNSSHAESVRELFTTTKHMGVDLKENYFVEPDLNFSQAYYDAFCDTYLSGLKNFHAFGSINDGKVVALIAFYESTEGPEWYWTQVRSKDRKSIPLILDEVASYNEANGRLKFYSLFNSRYAKTYRRLAFSDRMKERYGFFDEFTVPERCKCYYLMPWQILYNRTLIPTETLVRCSFLKQEYRTHLPVAGSL